jgi:hypothetical protein
MKELAEEREWARRKATERIGTETRIDRIFNGELQMDKMEAFIKSLPVDNRYWFPLQEVDGTLIFMYGVSGYGTAPYGGSAP